MHGHFEQRAGSADQATTDITGADPLVDLDSRAEPAALGGRQQRVARVTPSHGGAFSHQELVDYQEWSAAAELG